MLTALRIKNLALVADLSVQLQPGFNAITGETGAGKSIIIGALNLVLGERADRTLIRSGADSCSVEAMFDLPIPVVQSIAKVLDDNGLEPCVDHQLLLKRVFSAAGSNRQFINGSPATLQALAAVGRELVDMHGPHEHQSLLHPSKQLDILDAFAGLEGPRAQFAELVRAKEALDSQKAELIVDERTYAQQLDLLRFQTHEISNAQLRADEEESLESDFQRASNAAKLLELSQSALNLLSEQDDALMTRFGELGRSLQALERIDSKASDLSASLEQASGALNELQSGLRHYAESIELDPARLQQLEERLNVIHSLKRKYGGTVPDVIAFGEEARRKLEALESRDAQLAKLNAELDALQKKLIRSGQELSAQRRKAIPKLSKAAVAELNALGFKQSHFDAAIKTDETKLNRSGLDEIEFLFAPNPGEPARPLRAIASSGEMARVMLALKTVLASVDQIPLLVFDEIDANVGGETARVVGEKMLQIARQHQVVCITHLPACAACATAHFVVSKKTVEGRTISEIEQLKTDDRVHEIARMLGGQSAAAMAHAKALLQLELL
jgi:DNA repair protein RecN (Recombination protein N)